MTDASTGGTSTDRRRDLVDVLRDLAELRDSGLLTEAEFQQARVSTVAGDRRTETAEHPAR